MNNRRKRIDSLTVKKHIHADEFRFLIIRKLIIERCIASRRAFQAVKVVIDDLIEWNMICNHNAVCVKVIHVFKDAALIL